MSLLFLGSTGAIAFLATGLSYFVSTRVSEAIRQLVSASSEVAKGNLDARVPGHLKKRDVEQKEFARKKIME